MVIIALYLSMRSLGVRLDRRILPEFSRMITPLLVIFAIFRFVDLAKQGAMPYLFLPRSETAYFWLENILFIAAPLVLFNLRRMRETPIGLYWASVVTVMGFITHRINVSITALERATGTHYVPKWSEMAVTIMLVAAAVIFFRWAVLHLKIFPRSEGGTWLANSGAPAAADD